MVETIILVISVVILFMAMPWISKKAEEFGKRRQNKKMKSSTHTIFFVETKNSIPYNYDKQSLCSCIEDGCSKKVYSVLNPGIGAGHSYKIHFKDGEIAHIQIYKNEAE